MELREREVNKITPPNELQSRETAGDGKTHAQPTTWIRPMQVDMIYVGCLLRSIDSQVAQRAELAGGLLASADWLRRNRFGPITARVATRRPPSLRLCAPIGRAKGWGISAAHPLGWFGGGAHHNQPLHRVPLLVPGLLLIDLRTSQQEEDITRLQPKWRTCQGIASPLPSRKKASGRHSVLSHPCPCPSDRPMHHITHLPLSVM